LVRPYDPYIPKDISEVIDCLGSMMLESPDFIDKTGYFPGRNLSFAFHELDEGLQTVRSNLGENLYTTLKTMSDQMRAHFAADPENKTDDTLKGRALITEMSDLLIQHIRAAKKPT
jgi:hypothetical protein